MDDFQNNIATTGYLAINNSLSGSIETTGDIDWIRLELQAGEYYEFDLEGNYTNAGTLPDPLIDGIYDNNGTYIGNFDDDSGVALNANTVFQATYSGVYFIALKASGLDTGTYQLTATQLDPSEIPVDDYSNNLSTTGIVETNDSTIGAIDYDSDVDWIKVQLTQGQYYRVDLEGQITNAGTLNDPVIVGIYDSLGTHLGYYDDDSGEGTNSQIIFEPQEDGYYYISVQSVYGEGSYKLSVTEVEIEADDYSDDTNTTAIATVDEAFTGTIEINNDKDWVKVNLVEGEFYQVNLNSADNETGNSFYPYIDGIYDSSGAYLSYSSGNYGSSSNVLFNPTTSGEYFVSIGSNSNIGNYELYVDHFEAIDLQKNQTLSGEILSDNAATWVKVDLVGSESYRIDFKGLSSESGTLEDPTFTIFNNQGNSVGYDNDSGVGLDSSTIFEPYSSGEYLISLSSGYYANSNSGTFKFSVSDNVQVIDDDLQNNESTTGFINPNQTFNSSIDYEGDVDWVKISLEAGIDYQINLEGMDTAKGSLSNPLIGGIYDSYGSAIVYRDYDSQFVSFNDNNSGLGANSQINFQPIQSGDYYIEVSSVNSSGSYELSVNEIDRPYFIDALTEHSSKYVSGYSVPQNFKNGVIHYFISDGTDNVENNPTGYNQTQTQTVVDALQSWQDVADLNFNMVSTIEQADIVFFKDSSPTELFGQYAAGYATHFGDVHIENSLNIDYVDGEHHNVLVHEIGHVLGLGHPFDANPPLPTSEDSSDYTQMSYTDHSDTYAQGPQIFDIAATQYLYGVNQTINIGNNVYSLQDRYIADAAGIDEINATAETENVFISLEEGQWNYVASKSNSLLDENQSFIGYSTWIENAVGGSANDELIGNHLSNNLLGNAGNDSLHGGQGNDFLNGGVGSDIMAGGSGNDRYVVDNINDTIIEYANEGRDLIKGSINTNITGTYIEDIKLLGKKSIDAIGNDYGNKLTGNRADNYLSGKAGNDLLNGKAGNDVLNGGTGGDTMIGGTGNDIYVVDHKNDRVVENANSGTDTIKTTINCNIKGTHIENIKLLSGEDLNAMGNSFNNSIVGNRGDNTLVGKAGNDILNGKSGDDILNGGVGGDTLIGGEGNDIYIIDNANDKVIEHANSGIDLVKTFVNCSLKSTQVENIRIMGNDNVDASGNALDNTIIGNSANNVLKGAGGTDTLTGGLGQDVFVFNSVEHSSSNLYLSDVITDFTQGEDLIKLVNMDADSTTSGNQSFTSILDSNQNFDSAGQLKVTNSVLYGETNGDGIADFAIHVNDIIQLSLDDIIL